MKMKLLSCLTPDCFSAMCWLFGVDRSQGPAQVWTKHMDKNIEKSDMTVQGKKPHLKSIIQQTLSTPGHSKKRLHVHS